METQNDQTVFDENATSPKLNEYQDCSEGWRHGDEYFLNLKPIKYSQDDVNRIASMWSTSAGSDKVCFSLPPLRPDETKTQCSRCQSVVTDEKPIHHDSILRAATTNIQKIYENIDREYQYENQFAPKRILTKLAENEAQMVNENLEQIDTADGDYICRVNDVIVNPDGISYEIVDKLGHGTFGQVLKCSTSCFGPAREDSVNAFSSEEEGGVVSPPLCTLCLIEASENQRIQSNIPSTFDVDHKRFVALKIIKNKPAYFRQALIEVKILENLNRFFYNRIVTMLDYFVYRKHLVIVFELLSLNLYDVLKRNGFRGLSISLVKALADQICRTLFILSVNNVIHCDLKPENILLVSSKQNRIKLIDFGSASWTGHQVYTYIQSRFYRSIEVILGVHPFTTAIDMWSFGCILVELLIGIPLLHGVSEYDQLTRILEVFGPLPMKMLLSGRNVKKFFKIETIKVTDAQYVDYVNVTDNGYYGINESSYEDLGIFTPQFVCKANPEADCDGNPTTVCLKFTLKTPNEYFDSSRKPQPPASNSIRKFMSVRAAISSAPIKSTVSQNINLKYSERVKREALIDLANRCFIYDPDSRLNPSQALSHPFFNRRRIVEIETIALAYYTEKKRMETDGLNIAEISDFMESFVMPEEQDQDMITEEIIDDVIEIVTMVFTQWKPTDLSLKNIENEMNELMGFSDSDSGCPTMPIHPGLAYYQEYKNVYMGNLWSCRQTNNNNNNSTNGEHSKQQANNTTQQQGISQPIRSPQISANRPISNDVDDKKRVGRPPRPPTHSPRGVEQAPQVFPSGSTGTSGSSRTSLEDHTNSYWAPVTNPYIASARNSGLFNQFSIADSSPVAPGGTSSWGHGYDTNMPYPPGTQLIFPPGSAYGRSTVQTGFDSLRIDSTIGPVCVDESNAGQYYSNIPNYSNNPSGMSRPHLNFDEIFKRVCASGGGPRRSGPPSGLRVSGGPPSVRSGSLARGYSSSSRRTGSGFVYPPVVADDSGSRGVSVWRGGNTPVSYRPVLGPVIFSQTQGSSGQHASGTPTGYSSNM